MSSAAAESEDTTTTTKRAPRTITVRPGALVDGGKFKCDNPGHPHFETDDPLEWEKHRSSPPDTQTGETVCALCGNKTHFGHVPASIVEEAVVVKVACDKCKDNLVKETQAVKDANPKK